MSESPNLVRQWREVMLRRALWCALVFSLVMTALAAFQDPVILAVDLLVTGAVATALWRRHWSLEARVCCVVLAGAVAMVVIMRVNGFLTPALHSALVSVVVFSALMVRTRVALAIVALYTLLYFIVGIGFVAGHGGAGVAQMLDLESTTNWVRAGLLTATILTVTVATVTFFTRKLERGLTESAILLDKLQVETESKIQALEKSAALGEELRQSQKLEAVGALASGVAHDFNNLLVAIIGHTQLLHHSVKDETAIEHSDAILAAADQATALTGQLLAFSRRNPGAQRHMDVAEELARARAILKRLLPSNIAFSFELAEDGLGKVYASPSDLGQIVLNLCVNARDAMEEGGTLKLHVQKVETPAGEWVQIVVTDTGHGIPDEVREHIFEPFFTTKPSGKGTGIGLSLVARVVEALGGTVTVESAVGEGTTFEVRLPSSEGAQESEAERSSRAVVGTGQRILVVDDDAGVREIISNMLSHAGYRTVVYSRADEALKGFDALEGDIALLVTDAVMPGKGGYRLYEELVTRGYEGPCLVCSGYAGKVPPTFFEDSSRALLAKPFREQTLLAEVAALLELAAEA